MGISPNAINNTALRTPAQPVQTIVAMLDRLCSKLLLEFVKLFHNHLKLFGVVV